MRVSVPYFFPLLIAVVALLSSGGAGLSGCPTNGDDDDDDSGSDDDDNDDDDDDSATDDDDSMPPDPGPFTLTLTGADNEAILFDASECLIYPEPSNINFRTTWRGASHNAVLIAEVMGGFAGAGTYTVDAQTRIKLQSEAGSPYNFFYMVDTGQGDSGTVDVLHADTEAELVWGEFTFTAMHGSNGAIAVSPLPIPIWCPTLR